MKGTIIWGYHDFFIPNQQLTITLRILTPPMETPDPPNDTAGALKTGGFDTP